MPVRTTAFRVGGDQGEVHVFGDNQSGVGSAARPARGDIQEGSPVDVDLVALEAEEPDGGDRRTGVIRPAFAGDPPDDSFAVEAVTVNAPSRAYLAAKRALDLALATLLFFVSLPVIVFIALVVKCDSRGPAVFRQARVGRHGRVFTFYKFRTMYVDARDRFPELYAYAYNRTEIETMFFKLPDDPRCTRVGRLLRRTSLDELPNLLNVVKGDMSLVGPRPEIPEMLPHYRADQLAKFAVTPGLTGLAQIRGRNLLTFQETTEQDLEYVRRRSLLLDLYILVRTPVVVVQMIGAL